MSGTGAQKLSSLYKSEGPTGGAHHNLTVALTGDHEAGEDLSWKLKGLCRDEGTRGLPFFPERGQATAPASNVCWDCPVQYQCLKYGMGERFGIWGGYSERARRRLRRLYNKYYKRARLRAEAEGEDRVNVGKVWRQVIAQDQQTKEHKVDWVPIEDFRVIKYGGDKRKAAK